MEERPNIVVLVLDSARASSISCYGGDVPTPNLDALADDGIRFENAFVAAPWTVPSHASLFTGVYPAEHKTDKSNRFLNSKYRTLAESLSESGYETVLYSNNIHLTDKFGFSRGFDIAEGSHAVNTDQEVIDWADFIKNRENHSGARKYLEILRHILDNREKNIRRSIREAARLKYNHHLGDNGARETLRFFETHHRDFSDPYFAFVNFMEPHNPFRPPRGYGREDAPTVTGWKYGAGMESLTDEELETLRRLYGGEIRYIDERVGELVDMLDDGNTIFVVTADHGVEIDEHGLLYHGGGLYNTVTRVPLIINGAGSRDPVPYSAEIISLYRTLCGIADADVDQCVRGTNLLEQDSHETAYMEIRGQSSDIVEQIRQEKGAKVAEQNDPYHCAIAHGRHKYILDKDTGETVLYDYWEDADEQFPLTNDKTEAEMKSRLTDVVDSLSSRSNDDEVSGLGDKVQDRLRELGYIT